MKLKENNLNKIIKDFSLENEYQFLTTSTNCEKNEFHKKERKAFKFIHNNIRLFKRYENIDLYLKTSRNSEHLEKCNSYHNLSNNIFIDGSSKMKDLNNESDIRIPKIANKLMYKINETTKQKYCNCQGIIPDNFDNQRNNNDFLKKLGQEHVLNEAIVNENVNKYKLNKNSSKNICEIKQKYNIQITKNGYIKAIKSAIINSKIDSSNIIQKNRVLVTYPNKFNSSELDENTLKRKTADAFIYINKYTNQMTKKFMTNANDDKKFNKLHTSKENSFSRQSPFSGDEKFAFLPSKEGKIIPQNKKILQGNFDNDYMNNFLNEFYKFNSKKQLDFEDMRFLLKRLGVLSTTYLNSKEQKLCHKLWDLLSGNINKFISSFNLLLMLLIILKAINSMDDLLEMAQSLSKFR